MILLLVYGTPNQAQSRFVERVEETLLGVGIALVFRRRPTRYEATDREGTS
jgi:hypothetical protein